jgi:hypothetical protein
VGKTVAFSYTMLLLSTVILRSVPRRNAARAASNVDAVIRSFSARRS